MFLSGTDRIKQKFMETNGFWSWADHKFKEQAVSDHRDVINHWGGGHRNVNSH